jgi:hypothetical protein
MLRRVCAQCVLLAVGVSCADGALLDLRASARARDSPAYRGFDAANLDKTCKPCDEFFQFAMGGGRKSGVPSPYCSNKPARRV